MTIRNILSLLTLICSQSLLSQHIYIIGNSKDNSSKIFSLVDKLNKLNKYKKVYVHNLSFNFTYTIKRKSDWKSDYEKTVASKENNVVFPSSADMNSAVQKIEAENKDLEVLSVYDASGATENREILVTADWTAIMSDIKKMKTNRMAYLLNFTEQKTLVEITTPANSLSNEANFVISGKSGCNTGKVTKISYKLNNGNWMDIEPDRNWTTIVTLTDAGQNIIAFKCLGNAGVWSEVRSVTVNYIKSLQVDFTNQEAIKNISNCKDDITKNKSFKFRFHSNVDPSLLTLEIFEGLQQDKGAFKDLDLSEYKSDITKTGTDVYCVVIAKSILFEESDCIDPEIKYTCRFKYTKTTHISDVFIITFSSFPADEDIKKDNNLLPNCNCSK